jgi:outer membrane protein TolC
MMSSSLLHLAAGVVLASALRAPAALSLDDCIQKAVVRHPSTALAALDQQVATTRLAGVEAQRYPSLSALGGYVYSSEKEGNPDFIGNNAPHETKGQLALRWQPDTGWLSATIRRAQADRTAAGWAMRAARARLVLDVANSYFGVLRTQHAREALAEAIGGAHRQLAATERLVENGKASRFDLQRTVAATAVQEARLAQAESDLIQARRRLSLLIGDKDNAPLVEPAEPARPPGVDPRAMAAIRPDVQAAKAQILARQADLDLARMALWPQLSFTALGGLDTKTFPGLNELGFSAGVDLNWPIWDWGNLRSQVEAARLTALRSESEVRLAVQGAMGDVVDADAQISRSAGQLAALKRASQAADAALVMARQGFAEGGVTSLDVILAQQAAIEARLAVQSARYDYLTAVAFYNWATNGTEQAR